MSQTHMESDTESAYRTPRWVKVFGIIALILLLLVVVVVVTGLGGEHGPGRHAPPIEQEMQRDDLNDHAPPLGEWDH
jgi:hypothetical protein